MQTLIEEKQHELECILQKVNDEVSQQIPQIVYDVNTIYDRTDYDKVFETLGCDTLLQEICKQEHELHQQLCNHTNNKTQKSATMCEEFVAKVLKQNSYTPVVPDKHFKAFLKDKIENQILISQIDLKQTSLATNQYYYVYQPFGSQNTPDFLLFNVTSNGCFYMMPLEVKKGSDRPTWNNNPPKPQFLYIFVCTKDKKIYCASGKRIRTKSEYLNDEFVKVIQNTLCVKNKIVLYPDNQTDIISYKKIEPKHFPKYSFN